MVVALGPGKFYGSSLPRPRFYENPNGEERVDPPVPVLDPLISWAEEAHWSMGGLSFKRLRLQGRIEGNINKLRAEREKIEKRSKKKLPVKGNFPSPPSPAAPLNLKRKMRLVDESEDESEEVGVVKKVEKRGPVRKLDEDFDRVVEGGGDGGRNKEGVVEKAKNLKRLKKGVKSTGDKVSGLVTVTTNEARASPKLKKGVKRSDKVSGSATVTTDVGRTSPRLKKSGVR